MKIKLLPALALLFIGVQSCNTDNSKTEQTEINKTLLFCDCINPVDSLVASCAASFPLPTTTQDSLTYVADYVNCTGVNPFETQKVAANDAALEAYANDLSLEIKALPEEEKDPISDECKTLLEEYAVAIKSYSKLLNKIQKNPDDINLLISRGSEEENLYSFASKPLTFQCSSNPNFKKQIEILNGKRDKLISN